MKHLADVLPCSHSNNSIRAILLTTLQMNSTYFSAPCLGGFYGISIIHQFQSHKTVSIRSIFLILLPLFASGLWLTNYSNTTNTLSVSVILQRHSIHAKLIKFPHVHSESYSYAKNNDLLLHFLTIFHVVVFWSYILILMSDIEKGSKG